MKRKDGFTIIELLVTIIIFGVLASIAIPGFSRWLPSYRIKGAARDIFSNMQFAKMGAVKERAEWAVVFDRANHQYKIVSGGADGDYSTAGDNVDQKTVKLSDYESGIGYGHGNATAGVPGGGFDNDITFTGDTVVFNSRGMINSATGGYVYIQNSRNGTFAVGAWTTGVVVMRRWQNSAWQQ
ncbi:MAG: GspH/FimT family pseudopilin [Desulfobacteraceae bacterium]|jgi:type IV fimbrial biogenesis protein FimT